MSNRRPNILLIMADQFRTATMTGLGDGIETPNIDRLRSMSIFFPEAACTAPLCTPSRASLATGKLPHNCGVVSHDANLPLDQATYYQALRKAGYRVSVVGKTDLHKESRFIGKKGNLPVIYQIGFTEPHETEGKINCSRILRTTEDGAPSPLGPYQDHLLSKDPSLLKSLNDRYMNYMKGGPNKKVYSVWESDLDEEDFLDNFIGRESCRLLEEMDDEAPWHLMASFAGPHNPWDPPRSEYEKTKNIDYPLPPEDDMEGKPNWIKKRAANQTKGMTREDLLNVKRHYAASVAVIDHWVGEMLDILERRGLMDNTVIVFTADHGELMGDHNLFEKTAMYEGSVRIPMLFHMPGDNTRKECMALATLMDLAPTFMDLAGASYAPEDLDAKSLLPVISGSEKDIREVQISELTNTIMLYDGRYKWIRSFNDQNELYDLQEDRDELHNCIESNPEVIKRLQQYTFRV
ncbi:arylsulfatase A family protein [Lachnospiraceae bacterium JC7]|nr:arylsulfatase A family protein [Lachnospiraceae bacterium JC7]